MSTATREELDISKGFNAAYAAIIELLIALKATYPSRPEKWDCYDSHLAALRCHEPEMAALLHRRGQESPADARQIVAELVAGCIDAKAEAEGGGAWGDGPARLEKALVRVFELGKPLSQFTAFWEQEAQARLCVGPDQIAAVVKSTTTADETGGQATGMSWQDAAARMRRLQAQGAPWTSHGQLAKDFGCSSATTLKAVRNTPELRVWAKPQTAVVPRAQSINDMVTDRTAQSTEPDPADDAAIREYLERDLKPEERAFFNSLSREHQLFFLNDPEQHQKILGRKP